MFKEKPDDRKNYIIERNPKEQYKRIRIYVSNN